MKRIIVLITVLLCMGTMVFASGQSEGDSKSEGPLKVALILSGPANDQGWNAVALQGLTEAEEAYGIETAYTEHVGIADSEAAFTDYASQGFDLVIGHGFQYGDPAVRVGERFPKTKFMAIEGASSSENVAWEILAGISTLESGLPKEHFSPNILVFSINFSANSLFINSAQKTPGIKSI